MASVGWPDPLPFNTSPAMSVTVVAVVLPFLATLTTIGRFYARRRNKARIGADDWAIVAALFFTYGEMIIIVLSERYGGVGHHIEDLTQENITAYFKLITAVQFTFGTSLGFIKISLCLLLIRIFFTRPFKIAAWCVMAYCICWMLMVISIGAGLCRPIEFNWDKTVDGQCGNLNAAYVAIAALDILGDVMIIILPMRWVWKLNTTRVNKLGITFVFALGALDIIVAILRIIYLLQIDFTTPGADFTWQSTGTYLWSVTEPSLGVIVASAALLRPIFADCYSGLRSTLHGITTRTGISGGSQDSYYNIGAGKNGSGPQNSAYRLDSVKKTPDSSGLYTVDSQTHGHSAGAMAGERTEEGDIEQGQGIHVVSEVRVQSAPARRAA